MYCLQECMCALFSPEIVQAEAVKGLITIIIIQMNGNISNKLAML